MKKLKAALHVFYKSLTSPSYYADVIKVNFKFSLKYFAVLVVLATAITFPTSVLPTMMGFKEGLADYETHVLEMYPDDLVVTMTEGRLSINQPEPYIVPLPEDQKGVYLKSETGVDMSDIENLVVINSQGTIDGLDEHKSLVLINSKNILIRSNNKIEVYPLSEFPDGELTQDSVKDMLEKVRPVVDTLPYIVMIMALIATLVYYFGFRLFYLLFVSVILLVVGRIRGLSLNFTKYYQIGMHALTLPLLIEVIARAVEFPINLPMWFLTLNVIMGVIGIFAISKNQVDTTTSV